jgi:hypothetical protein
VFVTNHVLSGALIGRRLAGRPVAAFAVGVASHLVLDATPHWGCRRGPEFFLTVAKRDGVLGLTALAAAALCADRRTRVSTLAGMAGAVLLDLDKPSLHFFGWNPFEGPIQRFHEKVQNESSHGMQIEVGFGLAASVAQAVTTVSARRLGPRGARAFGPMTKGSDERWQSQTI